MTRTTYLASTLRRNTYRRNTYWSLALVAVALAVPAWADGGAAPVPPAGVPGQNPKDAAAVQYMKDLKPTLGKQADPEAKASIKKLVEFWKDKEVTDETKKLVPDLLSHYGREDNTLIASDAIEALGELGAAAGAPAVLEILDRALKAKEPSVDVYGSCLRALQKLADPKPATLKAIEELLKHRMSDVVGKAATAMSGYKDAPGKVRKELLEELIKQTEGTCSQAKDPKNCSQGKKWQIISFGTIQALNALSGQKFKDVQEARAWFNDHKKDKSWDS